MTTGLDDATEEHTNLWLKDDLMDEGSWMGRQVIDELEARGILVRNPSPRGVVEVVPVGYRAMMRTNFADREDLDHG